MKQSKPLADVSVQLPVFAELQTAGKKLTEMERRLKHFVKKVL
jgi:hypothetical protein